MQRVGLQFRVKQDKIDEYKRLHKAVWPDLLAALKAAGIRNYSLWLNPDGTQFGYLECDNWDAACKRLAESEVHTRWQELMQNYLETPTDPSLGGQPARVLDMSFLME